MTFTREELVAFVKEVVGEIAIATNQIYGIRLYRKQGDTALRIRYTINGSKILGVWIVPIPDEVMLANNEGTNPYDVLEARIEAVAIAGIQESTPEQKPAS